ncbi:hypothetical protein Phep_2039 [Pedobacter heparinus DSM 2366]|uniref:Uncharacterized protein n=1 Tax=Pedobacter heparinus (strain ATCC 13125 / DSM 2366 / CIP 104194 / JCM 7457 / NBRC 12017 / NCIMB 9290 / NRRL B-14731 / HIM 762-3) TaxID=485917 RepID=C6XWV0_PEDHD|nr:hypothetical protein Phep_2039 [Pedobacter heparinus DSM 2366]
MSKTDIYQKYYTKENISAYTLTAGRDAQKINKHSD